MNPKDSIGSISKVGRRRRSRKLPNASDTAPSAAVLLPVTLLLAETDCRVTAVGLLATPWNIIKLPSLFPTKVSYSMVPLLLTAWCARQTLAGRW